MTKQNKLEAIYTDAETNDLANNIHTRMNKRIDEIDAIKTDINLNSVESMNAIKSVRIDMMREIDRTDQNAIARDESLNEENENLRDEIENLKKQVNSLANSNYESKQASFQFKNSITEFLNTRKVSDVSQVQSTICSDLNLQSLQILEFAVATTIKQRVHAHKEQSLVNASADISECYHHTNQDIES